jgi:hypothetical protein
VGPLPKDVQLNTSGTEIKVKDFTGIMAPNTDPMKFNANSKYEIAKYEIIPERV